ncbi:MoaD/ThiS family protein [Angustibacter sp. McL0619]|uniref:MoaD/ThiS family protein n=1 Tax=Angustibacter sp. McL0619 TaxID=3415676 RepID=UPI003CF8ACD4
MAEVTVRYWAGARDAAGRDDERLAATSVQALLAELCARPGPLAEVVRRSSVLVDGLVVRDDLELLDGQTVEVLPPFAGG